MPYYPRYNSSYFSHRKEPQYKDNTIHHDKRFGDYKVVGRGTNAQGRSWVRRKYLEGEFKGKIGFDYHGKDGSYSYNHPDGGQYMNDGKGVAKYRAPGKQAWVDCSKGQESGAVVKEERKERKERKESRRKKEGSRVVVKKEEADVVVKKEEAA
ncbi:hypothetical protein HDK90DRAFT_74997 [Phyllosticta capitalensis]|uniref:Uncharacterized protein n=1 Tax=Phyllosticta capitalensis TaxID=121624 RepID=A0ABR1YDS5_9PEZI